MGHSNWRWSAILCVAATAAPAASFPLGLDYSRQAAPAVLEAASTLTMTVDSAGSVYFLGTGNPAELHPTTVLGSASNPAPFLVKLSPDGTQIQYLALLPFQPNAMAVDSSGNAYLGGENLIGKLNSSGTAMVYTTSLPDGYLISALALDSSGHAYVTGWSGDPQLPTTPGAFQPVAPNTNSHGFVVKVSADGSAFIYATYLAGSTVDLAKGVAVDSSGTAFIRGITESADFPVTPGAYQTSGGGQNGVPFLTRLSSDGTHLLYSTFLGNAGDQAQAVAADANGNALVAVRTVNGPVNLIQLNPQGTAVNFTKTLPPVNFPANGEALTIDANGNGYLAAVTASGNYPVKDSLMACGSLVMTVVDASGNLSQSTYLGGATDTTDTGVNAVALGPNSTVYVAGPDAAGTGLVTLARLSPNSTAQPVPLACVANAGSFEPGGISPGELVSLFGQGLGPAQGAQPADAKTGFPNTLAGVQVTFDGIAVPLLYVQDGQVNAIAPWSLTPAPGKTTQICVSYNSANTNCIQRTVVQAAPGVFTFDGTHAAALNQDGSINSANNPAKPGSIVSIYATGLGAITPSQGDGSVVGLPLPKNSVPVFGGTFMGGIIFSVVPMTPQYAGPAPFEVAGVSQINLTVATGPMFLSSGPSFYSNTAKSNSFLVYVSN
jgi:uncharacterized protein (TIGR03437 family)